MWPEFSNLIFFTLVIIFLFNFSVTPVLGIPSIKDPNLKVEPYIKDLKLPTTITFMGPDDMLVTELHEGKVYRILNRTLSQMLIDLNVSIGDGRGLYGVEHEKSGQHDFIYLSFLKSGNNSDRNDFAQNAVPSGNVLYRYELEDGRLTDPILVQNTTAIPGQQHYGGPLLIQRGFLFHILGDAGPNMGHDTQAVNIDGAIKADGTAGIIRIPIGNSSELAQRQQVDTGDYFAYGVRNGFGIDMDPLTGYLWDTENGPEESDELNLVQPGFNSGWKLVMGPIYGNVKNFDTALSSDVGGVKTEFDEALSANRPTLVDFAGSGKYSDPEFTWQKPVGATAVKFYPLAILGKQYENDIFAGDFNNGNLYHFDLSKDRTTLNLTGQLQDRVANTPEELSDVIIGTGFNGITDIKVGFDGYLYVVSHLDGIIYRIVPK